MRPYTRIMISVLLLLTACTQAPQTPPAPLPSSPVPQSTGPIRIGFAALAFEKAAYQPLIEAFNAENPDLQVEFVPIEPDMSSDFREQARSIAAQADTFASMLVGPEATNLGIGVDLRPLIDADATFERDDYQPGSFQASGPIIVLPTDISIQAISYNSELWAAAGLAAPATNWTWEDLLAAAEQLTKRQGDQITTYGIDDGRNGLLVFEGLLAEAGIALTPDANGAITLNTPTVATIVERMQDLIKRGVVYQAQPQAGKGAVSMAEIGAHIREGRVALWASGLLFDTSPDGGSATDFAIGDAAIPPTTRDNIINLRGYMLSAGSTNAQAAWRWLSYLSKQQVTFGAGLRLFGIGTDLPARKSLADARKVWDTMPASRATALQATLAQADTLPAASDPIARNGLYQLMTALQAGSNAEDALSTAQETIDNQLAERAKQPTAIPIVPVQLPEQAQVPAGATQVRFAAFGGDMAALRQLAEQYNAQNPTSFITIEPPDFTGEEFSLAAFAKNQPCLLWPQTPRAEEYSALRDLQPMFDADITFDQNDYPTALLEPMRNSGKLYGIPYAVQLRALTYNRSLFREANLSEPNPNWSVEEFLQAARQLTRKEGAEPQYGYSVEGLQTDDLLAFLQWQNAQIIKDGTPNFSDPVVVTALQQYLELLRESSPHTSLQGYRNDGVFVGGPLVQSGRVGMWYSAGFDGMIMIMDSGTAEQTVPDLAIVAPPMGANGLTSADFSASALVISAAASDAEAEACWGWLRFLSEQTTGLGTRFPARTSVAVSEAFAQQALPGATAVYSTYASALANQTQRADPYRGVDLFWLMRAADQALQGANLDRELAEAQRITELYLACTADGGKPAECARAADPTYAGIGPRE
jgi:ABC-type glycerol-3-phosphate transport system substrate-binding protein